MSDRGDELRFPLKVVRVERRCIRRACNGRLKFNGSGVTVGMNPTLWNHACTRCDATAQLTETFPRIEYVDKLTGKTEEGR